MAFPCVKSMHRKLDTDPTYHSLSPKTPQFLLSTHSPLVTFSLVHVLSALLRSARTRQLDILNGKLVIVRELLSGNDFLHGKDDDVLLSSNIHNPRIAVWLRRKSKR